jgi:hypothetical protein
VPGLSASTAASSLATVNTSSPLYQGMNSFMGYQVNLQAQQQQSVTPMFVNPSFYRQNVNVGSTGSNAPSCTDVEQTKNSVFFRGDHTLSLPMFSNDALL